MSRLKIQRTKKRKGLFMPMKSSKKNPSLMIPLYQVEDGELDELIRAILAKQGVTDEAEVRAVVDKAEHDAEVRTMVAEARKEIRRLMQLKREGATLMQVGFRKWSPVFYPATKEFKNAE